MIQKQLASPKRKISGNRSEGGDFFSLKPNLLKLEDGTVFHGYSPTGSPAITSGEVVFNTGMSGYVESLTDPSYAGQILVFTFPLIGNYGVHFSASESKKIHVRGVIVSEASVGSPDSRFDSSLVSWLNVQPVPLLLGVDTRALTKHLRLQGTMQGQIGMPSTTPFKQPSAHYVSLKKPRHYQRERTKTVILVDCGAKENILRSLIRQQLHVIRVPYDYDFSREIYDGVVLSNGPGDPTDYGPTIHTVSKALKGSKPIFGICLGSQIMGLAAGAKTYKLAFGHRGHNQPCMALDSSRCYITSQNHGYAIAEKSLPKGWKVSFRNLNDDSVEGIMHESKPFFSVQFHPEACPGPTDTGWLFEKFVGVL